MTTSEPGDRTAYCPRCRKCVTYRVRKEEVIGLLGWLTIFTLGMWPLHTSVTTKKKFFCSVCKEPVRGSPDEEAS